MRAEVVYSPSNDAKEAYRQIAKQLEQIDFEPNFLLLFLTEGVWKNYKLFIQLLKKKFPDAKMLGCTVEGYLVKDEIWMRGVAALLGEFDGKVEVFWAKDKTATRTAEKLGEKIGKGWDAILLMFPALYFPSKFGFLKYFLKDRVYYRRYIRGESVKEKEDVLKEFSDYLRSKFVFPINDVLKIVAEKTGGSIPILGLNLMPLEATSYTPLILADYNELGFGSAAMCFKGKANVLFHDIFPERGNSYEETFEVIKNYFAGVEEVKVVKGGLAIGEINGLKPVAFLKMKRSGFEDVSQDEFLKKVESGKLQMATPYGLSFISKETYGSAGLGLFNYPLNIYPSLFNVDNFYDEVIFGGEVFRGGVKAFAEIFEKKKLKGFDFYVVDQNAIMSFGGNIHKFLDVVREKSNKYFGIFSSFPSAYIPVPDKKYLSEVHKSIFANLGGTSAMVEFE
ncbi:hypothetical protein [Archaeoglobus veneficus]|uniref:FIST domain-containing protein n=1 Tax=Archaeoglobus veneficus (strain DSM 11195 / SNP6) TaxID=693661 RepID=F2KNA7_ARCVS|nr:hypothetical protein [Archaeoglobus veneficus]AEA46208.1 hypothetical protein Arcve_0169 [Archaeoglobus veneficus SNP6]